jgi:hypothetical protein
MDAAEFEAHVERVRATLERRAAQELEQHLSETPDHCWPPAPNTEHPGLASCAAMVRRLIADGHHTIYVVLPRRLRLFEVSDPSAWQDPTLALTVRRAWWFAPYVGDPFIYEWPVAVDHLNRHVAGDAYSVML